MRGASSTSTKSKICVVMPVTQLDLATALMKDMDTNTVRPWKAVILDDSDNGFDPPPVSFEVEYVRNKKWCGVNPLWNKGVLMADGADYVTVINDDMTIHDLFFEMMLRGMDWSKKAAVVCPQLSTSIREVSGSRNGIEVAWMSKREGGAFTFRKEVLDRIPPIPEELAVFFGDDWYFAWTQKWQLGWLKIMNSQIFHHGGKGVRQRDLRKRLTAERIAFSRLAAQNGLKVWWRP